MELAAYRRRDRCRAHRSRRVAGLGGVRASAAMLAVALALDLHTGTYKTLLYVGVGVGLALIGAPADDAEARAPDLLGAGLIGALGR